MGLEGAVAYISGCRDRVKFDVIVITANIHEYGAVIAYIVA